MRLEILFTYLKPPQISSLIVDPAAGFVAYGLEIADSAVAVESPALKVRTAIGSRLEKSNVCDCDLDSFFDVHLRANGEFARLQRVVEDIYRVWYARVIELRSLKCHKVTVVAF